MERLVMLLLAVALAAAANGATLRDIRDIVADYCYDEAKIAPYTLPDPLVCADGTPVRDARTWLARRRGELLDLLARYAYGWPLPPPAAVRCETLSEQGDALGGIAIRREVRLSFTGPTGRTLDATMLLYIPRSATAAAPVPVFLGLNFKGNHACTDEPDVRIATLDLSRQEPRYAEGSMKRRSAWPAARGEHARRWPFAEIVRRGYAVGTACYHDFYPDFMGAAGNSALALFLDDAALAAPQTRHTPIGAWAWGLSRMLDHCRTEPRIDVTRAAVIGHSRLGKTALWAGATDTRFRLVIANDSGCGGGALHRRKIGENIEALVSHRTTLNAADWFTDSFASFIGREQDLPFDQHELLALTAPRALCLGVATKDRSADPKGEFEAMLAARPVWRLFGIEATPLTEMPSPGRGSVAPVSFHVREGRHDIVLEDWLEYLAAADMHLR